MKYEEKFPCGCEFKLTISILGAILGGLNNNNKECPLHGKKCLLIKRISEGNPIERKQGE